MAEVCRELGGGLAAKGKSVLALVWGDTPWHVGKRVREWIGGHNTRVAAGSGCRIEVCGLPVKAPRLAAIEPNWVHGKRAVSEPDRKLTGLELKRRVSDSFGCGPKPDLQQAA